MARLSLSALLAAAALTLSLQAQAQESAPPAAEGPTENSAQVVITPTLKPDCTADKAPSAKSATAAATGSLLNKALESWGRKKGIDGLGQIAGRSAQSTIDTCSSLPKSPAARP